MKILYSTTAVNTGGRDGQVHVENSPLVFEMALPPALEGKKEIGVNPEQLFAAGYAACFGSALQHVIKAHKLQIPVPTVHNTVGIGRNLLGGFSLAVDIVVDFKGVDQKQADKIAAEAHTVCPYSNATKGNIDVKISAKVLKD